MMMYMILPVSLLVLFLSTGVIADDKGKALNYQLARPLAAIARYGKPVDMSISADDSQNKGLNTTLKAAKLVDIVVPADDSNIKEEPVDTPVPAQSAACSQFRLSGTNYKSAIHGTYLQTSSYCGGKPVYRAYISGQGYIYLFYDTASDQWAFHQTKCSSYGYVTSVTKFASRPDYVTSWAEVNTLGNWVTNIYIRVNCVYTAPTPAPGCNSYELYGSRYKKGIHGWYSKTSYTCSGKPVYSFYSSDFRRTVYLYYYGSAGLWYFAPNSCSTTVYIKSRSYLNNFPDDVVYWAEVDTSGNFYQNSDIGVKCSSDTANINPLVVMILLVCGCVATW